MAKQKTYNLENINELILPDPVSVEELLTDKDDVTEPKEEKTYTTVATTSLVTVVSYMMGLEEKIMDEYYGQYNGDIIRQLHEDVAATTIRYLNRLRTALMQNFKNTDNEILYNLGNIDRIEWFNNKEIRQLQKWGIPVVQINYRADRYSEYFCQLISDNIDKCAHLFPDWVKFEYIRDLFVVPKYNKVEVLVEEYEKYQGNIANYPFQMYIHWDPADKGNILYSDGKFLSTIYEQHHDYFEDRSKYRDATQDTKRSIYDYIDKSIRVQIVVDCENSDVYKLHGMLKNLDEEEISKIEKIVLYDDSHTTAGWDWLQKFVKIPVEHVEVERVSDHKSLVDLRMTAGVCEAYYKNGIDSFIICSSDSDFWGLISSLPEARFLVLYEYNKCGKSIKDALTLRQIFHCSIDDFYTGNAGEIQKVVLRKQLEKSLPYIVGMNAWDLVNNIYDSTYVKASETEKQLFYDKYIKTLRLRIDKDGVFFVEVVE